MDYRELEKKKKAYLVLADKTIFTGYSFGAEGYTEGEVVFNTGITGYQEILTDPSYSGQIVTMTYPQIGNYGYIEEDSESKKVQVRGFVVREYCDFPNNYREKSTISDYLKKNNILGIEGIDTRALTKKLRSSGTMLGFITTKEKKKDELLKDIKKISDISEIDLVSEVSSDKEYEFPGNGLNVGIIDCGMKLNQARIFSGLGHKVTVLPSTVESKYVLNKKFDMLMFSNGPGDPRFYKYLVVLCKELIGKLPIAGICLGNQILGLALGGEIYKLKFGHRGGNHPVKNLITDKVYISTQNHGYVVDMKTLPKDVEVNYINLNDNTNEGIMSKKHNIYAVQFHPEAAPGPFDCNFIFNDFISNLKI